MDVRSATLAIGLAASLSAMSPASASDACDTLEGRTIEWIVPYSPGGGYDVYSRLLEPFVEDALGAEIAVRNVSGAGGLVGSKTLSEARPDGTVLGLMNASSLLQSEAIGELDAPRLTEDFTLLARVGRADYAWFAGADTESNTLEDLEARAAAGEPPVFAVADTGSGTFLSIVIGSHLLGLSGDIVAGYRGTREMIVAIARGDADVSSTSIESFTDAVQAGEVRPILQIGLEPASEPGFENLPRLGGPDGLAAQRAAARGGDPAEAAAMAEALAVVSGAGRIIAGPKGMAPELAQCLEERLLAVLEDPAFVAVAREANRSLDIAPGSSMIAGLHSAAARAKTFAPMLEAAAAQLR